MDIKQVKKKLDEYLQNQPFYKYIPLKMQYSTIKRLMNVNESVGTKVFLKEYKKAIRFVKKYVYSNSSNSNLIQGSEIFWRNLATSYKKEILEDYAKTMEEVNIITFFFFNAQIKNPKNADNLIDIAKLHELMYDPEFNGQADRIAAKLRRRIYSLDPDNISNLEILAEDEDDEISARFCKRIIELDENNIFAHKTLGWINEDPKIVRYHYKEAADLDPNDYESRYHLIEVCKSSDIEPDKSKNLQALYEEICAITPQVKDMLELAKIQNDLALYDKTIHTLEKAIEKVKSDKIRHK